MSFVIAAAQSASIAGNVPRNIANHLRFGAIAAEHEAELLVFPELSLIGYELAIARSCVVRPDSSDLDPVRDLAIQARMTVVVGAPLPGDNDILHIGAIAFRPDGSAVTYRKEYVHSSEQHAFTSGPGGPMLHFEDASVALAICADASHPEHAARAAGRGANVYAASVMIDDEGYGRKAPLLENYAREHRIAVLMANYSAVTGGDVSAGKSAIWSEDGRVVAMSTGNQEELVVGTKQNGLWGGTVLPLSKLFHRQTFGS